MSLLLAVAEEVEGGEIISEGDTASASSESSEGRGSSFGVTALVEIAVEGCEDVSLDCVDVSLMAVEGAEITPPSERALEESVEI